MKPQKETLNALGISLVKTICLYNPLALHGIKTFFSHVGVFNKNFRLLMDQCEIFADSGIVLEIGEIVFNMTFSNMMECVMSQTSKDSERYVIRRALPKCVRKTF